MSKLTWSTTRRVPNRLRSPWAIRPSIGCSPALEGSRHGWSPVPLAVLGLGVEDRLDPSLAAALDHAPVLGQDNGDPASRHHVVVLPDAGVADEHDALLGIEVFRPLG